MERELLKLFDFQKFQNHKKLAEMVAGVEKRYPAGQLSGRELSDDELDLFAAGDMDSMRSRKNDDKSE